MMQKIKQRLRNFWLQSVNAPYPSEFLTPLFFILCLYEPLYKLGFALVFWRRKRAARAFPFPIISVGNISVGGAGKSVVVSYLVDHLGPQGAIITRGYGRDNARQSVLINDGKKLIIPQGEAGDEPAMFAMRHGVPVIVGADRAASLDVALKNDQHIKYALLDDAYQNPSIIKSCDILLLDARRPFENNHCLPAGKLREKDYTRADIILLTHADAVEACELEALRTQLITPANRGRIFACVHQPTRLKNEADKTVSLSFLSSRKISALAAIGSFDGFVTTLKQLDATVAAQHEFPDHHRYTADEFENIVADCEADGIEQIVTTAKDWPKLFPLLHLKKKERTISLYRLEVDCAFVTPQEQDSFNAALNEVVREKY